ncbi:MAG: sigma 54-interacting transcriptional regulator [Desulfarculaceae bacterium]|nr:sigma 54-interacting transcriptional regulator [Desulfarculaceae bacterium]
MNLKIKLLFTDRIGLVADTSAVIAGRGLNIVCMEVVRKNNEARVYVEVEAAEDDLDKEKFFSLFRSIDELVQIKQIRFLPNEEKTNRFRTVLDNMSDGVISVDRDGTVTTTNRIVREMLDCDEDGVVGKPVRELDVPHENLLGCLEGGKADNVKQSLITRKGRYRYISTCKPIRDAGGRVIGAVEIVRDMQEVKKMARSISEASPADFSDIVGKNRAVTEAIAFAQKIAGTDMSVSIYGASGTGKELFARAIHAAGKRPGRFVPVNCAALPENLLESELFGYEGGAFTGGRKEGKAGLFEIAENGTVFLDEVAEMPLSCQAKLLRVIQERAVRRIGGTKEIAVNARIITATNRNLDRQVEKKRFRQDLYYRINVLFLHIPPLGQRTDDIPLLADHFLFRLAGKLEKRVPELTNAALDRLRSHDWPGNVRELKNVIERAAFLSENGTIDADAVFFSHELHPALPERRGNGSGGKSSIKEQVAEFESGIIRDALRKNGSIRKAARALAISHVGLMKKMEKYGIEVERLVTNGKY